MISSTRELVREINHVLETPNASLVTAVSRAINLAKSLHMEEEETWLQRELRGYRDPSDHGRPKTLGHSLGVSEASGLPERVSRYRMQNAAVHIVTEEGKVQQKSFQHPYFFTETVAELEDRARKTSIEGDPVKLKVEFENLPPDLQVTDPLGGNLSVSYHFPSEIYARILAGLRSEVAYFLTEIKVTDVDDAEPVGIPANGSSRPVVRYPRPTGHARAQRKRIDPRGIVVGGSPAIFHVFEQIARANAAAGLTHVFLLGETGVGKTHIAKLIHSSSKRAEGPYSERNAGLSGGDLNIQKGEWVGYGPDHGIVGIDKKGRSGVLNNASGATLFVDEVGTLSHELQMVFLSAMEKRPVEKVGGTTYVPDVRCIFATNADIDQLMEIGKLRRDFVGRVGASITIPPLRDHCGDILSLATKFAGTGVNFNESCKLAMLRYAWPTNVREVKLRIEGAMGRICLEGGTYIKLEHLDLPADLTCEVEGMAPRECSEQLWRFADAIAALEGFYVGAGRQKRVADILCVEAAQASKRYNEFNLTREGA